MKKMLFILTLALTSTGLFAQAVDDQLDVSAEILVPLTIDCDTPLDMGKFVQEYGVAEALSVDNSERGGNALNIGSQGQCLVTGAADAEFFIYVTDDAGSNAADTATLSDGVADTLEVALIEAGGAALDSTSKFLDASGDATLDIDGSIAANLGTAKAAGIYNGSVTVEVEY